MANPSSQQHRPADPSTADRPDRPLQTGALPGGQPGRGVNTSSSPDGQSNVDAAARQGVEYGTHQRPPR